MINDVFGVIATVFPTAVFFAIVMGLVLLGRTWSRMSSGSVGAGPGVIPTPAQHGLQRVPWDLQDVRRELDEQSPTPLTTLLTRAHDLGVSVVLPADTSPGAQIESTLDQLEAALDLPPIESSEPPKPESHS